MLDSSQVRSSFIEFFEGKGHTFVPSWPVLPVGDDSLLFTNAGMNQFKDIFTGQKKADIKSAVNSQKCLRVSGKHNDLEEVGTDGTHHTFFEMLGNWSFNDYFKQEAIQWAWELLTDVWGFDENKLWATVFAGDEKDGTGEDTEARNLWTDLTPLPPERVLAFDKKENFWEMGDTGPCGPCSEIHIDLGEKMCSKKGIEGHKCEVNGGCGRFVELWNLVFIQYNRQPGGELKPLKAKYIDTGAGLERVTAVLQGKSSNYDTDLFLPIIEKTGELSGCEYTGKFDNKTDNAFRVIADHIRALVFAITDGVNPSNDGRGYVIRRILRRASRFARELDMHEPVLYKLVPTVVEVMGKAFPEIRERADFVSTVIESEEKSFGRTLDRGIEIFSTAAEKAETSPDKTISGKQAFTLYDTYGFPFDLTVLMARERGLKVDREGFEKYMQQQRERARTAQKQSGGKIENALAGEDLPSTDDLHKYYNNECRGTVKGFVTEDGFTDAGDIEEGFECGVVLDKTCFYAEAGGQVGDCGKITAETGEFIVEDTVKSGNCVIHKGKVSQGKLSVDQKAAAKVSPDRNAIRKNHTATHLLQWALRQVVGGDVIQKGSLVTADYLRFDFTCPKALTAEQIEEVEDLVCQKITEDAAVNTEQMSREQAEQLGAMALFGEKYGKQVRVVAIGADKDISSAFSKEFCGGTHVNRLGEIGDFKILKEESVSAGVRRITAITGQSLKKYRDERDKILQQVCEVLKVPAEQAVDKAKKIVKENKKLSKELKNASKSGGTDVIAEAKGLLEKSEKVDGSSIIAGALSSGTAKDGRAAVDMLKKKAGSAGILLGLADNGKVMLVCGVTDDLVEKGLKAGDIVKEIAPIVGGGGGGRPQMAQAGGKNPEKLNEAVTKAAELMKQKLGG